MDARLEMRFSGRMPKVGRYEAVGIILCSSKAEGSISPDEGDVPLCSSQVPASHAWSSNWPAAARR
jgi:hypothetical protein